MQRIAVINPHPGVGKTTVVTSLGHALALTGHRVTLIDLDPRGVLAAGFGLFRAPSKGIDRVLLNGTTVESVSIGARDLLALIPSGSLLNRIEEKREHGAVRAHALERAIEGHFINQDFVIFDCPPAIDMLAANAIFTVDEILIPVTSDQASLNGAAKTLLTLKRFDTLLTRPVKPRILFNRYRSRCVAARAMQQKLKQHFSALLLNSRIPEGVALAECRGIGRTIFEYRPTSSAAKGFLLLANELSGIAH